MGSTSDLPVMKKAADLLNEFQIPFEMHALSAHRTPKEVEEFSTQAADRGIKVIIAGAGMAAHLAGVVAAMTPVPVIGVPLTGSLEGLDAMLAMIQMPPGIPVSTMAINGAKNAALLAVEIFALTDEALAEKLDKFRQEQTAKVMNTVI